MPLPCAVYDWLLSSGTTDFGPLPVGMCLYTVALPSHIEQHMLQHHCISLGLGPPKTAWARQALLAELGKGAIRFNQLLICCVCV